MEVLEFDTAIYRIRGNFRQEKIFTNFAICSYWQNIYPANFLSCVNDYIEDMVTFTALVKIYFTEYFCNTTVAGLGEFFVQRKFCRIRYNDRHTIAFVYTIITQGLPY